MRSGPEVVSEVVQRQRIATVRSLQEFTRMKAAAEADGDLAWLLMLDAFVFQAESEARWLDLCEARLAARQAERGQRTGSGAQAPAVPAQPEQLPERSI
jgi:hypothetical protein